MRSVTTQGQGHTAKRSPILGSQSSVQESQRQYERKPRPPEAGLCGERPALSLGGPKIRGPAPAVHCLCPNSYTLGISTGMSPRLLKLMCEPSCLPTCTCLLFQTCSTHSISEGSTAQARSLGISPISAPTSSQLPSPALCNLPMPAAATLCEAQLLCCRATLDKCLSLSVNRPLHCLHRPWSMEEQEMEKG